MARDRSREPRGEAAGLGYSADGRERTRVIRSGTVASVEFAGMNELGPHAMGTAEVALA